MKAVKLTAVCTIIENVLIFSLSHIEAEAKNSDLEEVELCQKFYY